MFVSKWKLLLLQLSVDLVHLRKIQNKKPKQRKSEGRKLVFHQAGFIQSLKVFSASSMKNKIKILSILKLFDSKNYYFFLQDKKQQTLLGDCHQIIASCYESFGVNRFKDQNKSK